MEARNAIVRVRQCSTIQGGHTRALRKQVKLGFYRTTADLSLGGGGTEDVSYQNL